VLEGWLPVKVHLGCLKCQTLDLLGLAFEQAFLQHGSEQNGFNYTYLQSSWKRLKLWSVKDFTGGKRCRDEGAGVLARVAGKQ
jgi:hypothetical protein